VEAVRVEIARLEEVFAEAVQRRDQQLLESLVAPTFTLTSAGTGVVPRAAWLHSVLAAYVVEWFDVERVDVDLYGHVAVANVRYSQRAVWEGEPLAYTFLITDVWVSLDARWQLVARHSSPLP
jgi:Domain of unknown function (DUF4440)